MGQRMKLLLTARGMSQSQLAKECDQDTATINAYANGLMVPGIDKVYRIAEVLDTTPDVLCGWSELSADTLSARPTSLANSVDAIA